MTLRGPITLRRLRSEVGRRRAGLPVASTAAMSGSRDDESCVMGTVIAWFRTACQGRSGRLARRPNGYRRRPGEDDRSGVFERLAMLQIGSEDGGEESPTVRRRPSAAQRLMDRLVPTTSEKRVEFRRIQGGEGAGHCRMNRRVRWCFIRVPWVPWSRRQPRIVRPCGPSSWCRLRGRRLVQARSARGGRCRRRVVGR